MRHLDDGLWVHEDVMALGPLDLPLRMTIVKLAGGGLWVHSPTAISEELKQSVDALGSVAYLVAPNNAHHLWLLEWRDAYPDAKLCVATGVPKKLPALGACDLLDDAAPSPWSADLDQASMRGVPFFDENVFLHRASRSLIVTDFVANARGRKYRGMGRVLAKLLLEPIGFKDIHTAPPLKFPFVIKDRRAFRGFVDKVASWDFERIIVTHGDIIEDMPTATLRMLCARFRTSD